MDSTRCFVSIKNEPREIDKRQLLAKFPTQSAKQMCHLLTIDIIFMNSSVVTRHDMIST